MNNTTTINVLFVEDFESDQLLIAAYLGIPRYTDGSVSEMGFQKYQVSLAGQIVKSLKAAKELLRKQLFDVCVVDLWIPENEPDGNGKADRMYGLALLGYLRNRRDIATVVATKYSPSDEISGLRSYKVDGFISKMLCGDLKNRMEQYLIAIITAYEKNELRRQKIRDEEERQVEDIERRIKLRETVTQSAAKISSGILGLDRSLKELKTLPLLGKSHAELFEKTESILQKCEQGRRELQSGIDEIKFINTPVEIGALVEDEGFREILQNMQVVAAIDHRIIEYSEAINRGEIRVYKRDFLDMMRLLLYGGLHGATRPEVSLKIVTLEDAVKVDMDAMVNGQYWKSLDLLMKDMNGQAPQREETSGNVTLIINSLPQAS